MHAQGAVSSRGSHGRTQRWTISPVVSFLTMTLQLRNHSIERQTGQCSADSDDASGSAATSEPVPRISDIRR